MASCLKIAYVLFVYYIVSTSAVRRAGGEELQRQHEQHQEVPREGGQNSRRGIYCTFR